MKSLIAALALLATPVHAETWYPKSAEFEGTIEVTRGKIIADVEGTTIVCTTGKREKIEWMTVSRMVCDDGRDRDWIQTGPDIALFGNGWFTK